MILIFDFDGTLYNSCHGIALAFKEAIDSHIELMPQDVGPPIDQIYDNIVSRKKEFVVGRFRDLYDSKYCMVGTWYPGVLEFFSKRKSLDLYILLTNKPTAAINKISPWMAKVFDVISCIDDTVFVNRKKSERLKLILDKNHALDKYYSGSKYYIGDTGEDMIASDANNCTFIYAAYGYGEIREDCDRINSFTELTDILCKLELH